MARKITQWKSKKHLPLARLQYKFKTIHLEYNQWKTVARKKMPVKCKRGIKRCCCCHIPIQKVTYRDLIDMDVQNWHGIVVPDVAGEYKGMILLMEDEGFNRECIVAVFDMDDHLILKLNPLVSDHHTSLLVEENIRFNSSTIKEYFSVL